MNDPQPLTVVALCGSLRHGSYTRLALQIALEGAAELGAHTRLIDLRDYNLILAKASDKYPDDVYRLRADVRGAQGILLGTPEYHGSFSGVLKNALDLMGFEEFEGKMLGLVGVSGGAMGAISALASLRAIGRALHAWVVPQEVAIPQAWQQFDDQGQLTNERLRQRLIEVGQQVTRFAYLHASQEAQEFLRLWESAPPNPGGQQ